MLCALLARMEVATETKGPGGPRLHPCHTADGSCLRIPGDGQLEWSYRVGEFKKKRFYYDNRMFLFLFFKKRR